MNDRNPSDDNIEFEVIPPGQPDSKKSGSGNTDDDAIMRIVALIMDNLFTVPGTKIRFGLDPIIGLFPGLGDSSANLISALTLFHSARYGLPRIVMARMALNIVINAVFGAIPGIGDLFSMWWKSNQRNYELLQKHLANPGRISTKSDWVFVTALLVTLVIVVLLIAGTAAWMTFNVLRLLFGGGA